MQRFVTTLTCKEQQHVPLHRMQHRAGVMRRSGNDQDSGTNQRYPARVQMVDGLSC